MVNSFDPDLGGKLLGLILVQNLPRERSGSVGECLTRDGGATGWSLTGVTVLCARSLILA